MPTSNPQTLEERQRQLEKCDELRWRAVAALSQLRVSCDEGSYLVVARVARGEIAAEVVPGSWGTFTVDAHGVDLQVSRSCEFCARAAVGTVPQSSVFAPGAVVCDRCKGTAEIEPL